MCVCFGACISSAALRAFWGSSFTSFCLDLLPPPWGRAGDPEPLWGLPFWGPRLASEPSRCQIPDGVVQERAGSWRLRLSSPKSHGLSHARSHPGLLPELVPTLGELAWVSGTSWRSQQWSGEKKKGIFEQGGKYRAVGRVREGWAGALRTPSPPAHRSQMPRVPAAGTALEHAGALSEEPEPFPAPGGFAASPSFSPQSSTDANQPVGMLGPSPRALQDASRRAATPSRTC